MKKQTGIRICFLLLLCLVCGLLSACGLKEATKVIVLDENGDKSGENEYSVKNIKEYFYEGISGDENWIAWENDSEYIYILKKTDEGYEFRKIDIGRSKIVSKFLLPMEKTDIIKNTKISPGGKCIAYEREYAEGVDLYLYYTEENELSFVFSAEEIQFEWSGDGNKLFYSVSVSQINSTDGKEYTRDASKSSTHVLNNWSLHCWNVNSKSASIDLINKVGDEDIKKIILPNKNGSQVYIFDKERTGEDYFITLDEKVYYNNSVDDSVTDSYGECTDLSEILKYRKKVIRINQKKIIELPKEITKPIKFTNSGLYVQGDDGKIYLVTNLLKKHNLKMVAKADSEQIYICENGNHVFKLKHEDGEEQFEIRSMLLKNGDVLKDNLLYKDNYRSWADAIVSIDDSAIMIKSCEYFGENKYSMKIIVLEY